MFSSLENMLSHQHHLFQLSNKINRKHLKMLFLNCIAALTVAPLPYSLDVCGLLILKHLCDVSDEIVISQWGENAYYQYFCIGL